MASSSAPTPAPDNAKKNGVQRAQRTKRGTANISLKNEIDQIILDEMKREQDLGVKTTEFFITTRRDTLPAHKLVPNAILKNGPVKGYFDRPEIIESYRKQQTIETPEFQRVEDIGNVFSELDVRWPGETGVMDTSEAAYQRHHKRWERQEKGLRLRDIERLKGHEYHLTERIPMLENMESSSFLSIDAKYFSGPPIEDLEDTVAYNERLLANGIADTEEGERRRVQMLDTARNLVARLKASLPPKKRTGARTASPYMRASSSALPEMHRPEDNIAPVEQDLLQDLGPDTADPIELNMDNDNDDTYKDGVPKKAKKKPTTKKLIGEPPRKRGRPPKPKPSTPPVSVPSTPRATGLTFKIPAMASRVATPVPPTKEDAPQVSTTSRRFVSPPLETLPQPASPPQPARVQTPVPPSQTEEVRMPENVRLVSTPSWDGSRWVSPPPPPRDLPKPSVALPLDDVPEPPLVSTAEGKPQLSASRSMEEALEPSTSPSSYSYPPHQGHASFPAPRVLSSSSSRTSTEVPFLPAPRGLSRPDTTIVDSSSYKISTEVPSFPPPRHHSHPVIAILDSSSSRTSTEDDEPSSSTPHHSISRSPYLVANDVKRKTSTAPKSKRRPKEREEDVVYDSFPLPPPPPVSPSRSKAEIQPAVHQLLMTAPVVSSLKRKAESEDGRPPALRNIMRLDPQKAQSEGEIPKSTSPPRQSGSGSVASALATSNGMYALGRPRKVVAPEVLPATTEIDDGPASRGDASYRLTFRPPLPPAHTISGLTAARDPTAPMGVDDDRVTIPHISDRRRFPSPPPFPPSTSASALREQSPAPEVPLSSHEPTPPPPYGPNPLPDREPLPRPARVISPKYEDSHRKKTQTPEVVHHEPTPEHPPSPYPALTPPPTSRDDQQPSSSQAAERETGSQLVDELISHASSPAPTPSRRSVTRPPDVPKKPAKTPMLYLAAQSRSARTPRNVSAFGAPVPRTVESLAEINYELPMFIKEDSLVATGMSRIDKIHGAGNVDMLAASPVVMASAKRTFGGGSSKRARHH